MERLIPDRNPLDSIFVKLAGPLNRGLRLRELPDFCAEHFWILRTREWAAEVSRGLRVPCPEIKVFSSRTPHPYCTPSHPRQLFYFRSRAGKWGGRCHDIVGYLFNELSVDSLRAGSSVLWSKDWFRSRDQWNPFLSNWRGPRILIGFLLKSPILKDFQ